MPNWCLNRLTVSGSPERIREFMDKFLGYPAVFSDSPPDDGDAKWASEQLHALYPIPEDILKAGFNAAGYDWCRRHWSTKWDIKVIWKEVNVTGTQVTYDFDTAWEPPHQWLAHVCAEWNDLKFRLVYFEPGLVIGGEIFCEEGNCFLTQYEDFKDVFELGKKEFRYERETESDSDAESGLIGDEVAD